MEIEFSASFGAEITLNQVKAQARSSALSDLVVNKWDLFKDLTVCRTKLGISDRALAVVYALLSCIPKTALSLGAELVVFASNAEICRRANGLSEATFRRQVSSLVEAGLLVRRDSPNGKRYRRKSRSGDDVGAFGLDVTPLICRAPEISELVRLTREEKAAAKAAREEISLLRRNVMKMAALAEAKGLLDAVELAEMVTAASIDMRRAAGMQEIEERLVQLSKASKRLSKALAELLIDEPVSGIGGHGERHYRDSKSESLYHLNQGLRDEKEALPPKPAMTEARSPDQSATASERTVPIHSSVDLEAVVAACPDVAFYSRSGIRSWDDLVRVSDTLARTMQIGVGPWREARSAMGEVGAAVMAAALLQQSDRVANPGGYVRSLARKAVLGQFQPGAMIKALISRDLKAAYGARGG